MVRTLLGRGSPSPRGWRVGPRPRRPAGRPRRAGPATAARTAGSPATSSCRAPAPSGRCAGSPTCATGSGGWAATAPLDARPHLVFFLHDEVVVHTPAALADAVAAEAAAAAATAGRPAVPRPPRRLPAQRLGRAVLRRRRQAQPPRATEGCVVAIAESQPYRTRLALRDQVTPSSPVRARHVSRPAAPAASSCPRTRTAAGRASGTSVSSGPSVGRRTPGRARSSGGCPPSRGGTSRRRSARRRR